MADPYLQCSVLCDDVGRTGDGKLIIHGIFEAILSADFPATHRSCYICNRWTGGTGRHREKVRVLGPDGLKTVVEGPEITFDLKDRSVCHTVTCRLDGLRVPEPGVYWVQVVLNDRVVCEYALTARRMKESDRAKRAGSGDRRPKHGLVQD